MGKQRKGKATLATLVLVVLFIFLLALAPATSGALTLYNTSATTYRTWFIMMELPLLLIWAIAFYGSDKLRRYAASIANSPEGEGFLGLARGCTWLAWGLPISAVATLVLIMLGAHADDFIPATIVLSNYISLLFPILAFSIMSKSTNSLREKYNLSPRTTTHEWRQQALLTLIGVAYAYLLLRHSHLAVMSSANNQFYLPGWLVVLSLIIPYMYAWFLGLLTVFDIVELAKRSPGVIYRKALRMLAIGLVVVICSLMSVQYLHAQIPRTHESLGISLATAYFVYLVSIAGFTLIAKGVHDMQKIEEV